MNIKLHIGSIIHSNDRYFYKSDGIPKSREAVVVYVNEMGELALVKLTTSKNPKYKLISNYNGKSKAITETLYIKDNDGQPIKISNAKQINNINKFIKSSFPDISEKSVEEIIDLVVNDAKYGQRNISRLEQIKKRK